MECWRQLLFLTFWMLVRVPASLTRHELPVLWITPLNNNLENNGNITAEVLPAVELALRDLREQPSPLGDYELQFHSIDSECDNAKTLKAFFDVMYNGPRPLMVFGGGCSSVTSVVAQSLEAWHLVQLSFAEILPSLANNRQFPNFYRSVPSDAAVNLALVQFLRHYGWTRVGILTQSRFIETQGDLHRQLDKANISAIEENFLETPCDHVIKLKEMDMRIVVARFDSGLAVDVLCCIHKLGMFGQKYQWILPELTQDRLMFNTSFTSCSPSDVLTTLEGSVSADVESLSSEHTRGISGRTPQEYEKEYDTTRHTRNIRANRFHGFAYDGTWAIAKSLTRVMETLRYQEKYNIHRNATVSEQEVGEMILEAMDNISFFGVTGPVMFENGERIGNVKFTQIQEGMPVNLGKYSGFTKKLEFISTIRFKGVEPTKDRTHVYPRRKVISMLLYCIIAFLSYVGIVAACCLLVFNVKNRNHWAISMSRPFSNSLIILGTILSYTCIFFMGLDGSYVSDSLFETSCSVQLWGLSVGYTLCFGVMLAKTCSIKNNHLKNLTGKDYSLVLVVFLLFVDLSLLTCLQYLDPLKRTVKTYTTVAEPNGRDFLIQPFSEHCENIYMNYWFATFCCYKGLLLLSVCALSWTTRHLVGPMGNDSGGVRSSVCVSSVVILSGGCASELWQDQPEVQFSISALVIFTCCSSSLCVLFVPKIMIIWMGPEFAFLSRRFHLTQCNYEMESEREQDSADQRHTNISSRINALLSDNFLLKLQISDLDSELEDLTRQLIELSPHFTESVLITHSVGKADKCLTLPVTSDFSNILENINSPEHVQRRLSLQLPILHHAYLPSIGGVDSSPLNSPHHTPTPQTYGVLLSGV